MFRNFISYVVFIIVFGVAIYPSEAQTLSNSQGNTMERRMAEMALRAKTDHILADTVSYQGATDCTAVYMGNRASFLDGGFAEIQVYARNVATWQSMRMRRAKKEGVEVKDLSADNYCDTISVDCNNKKQVTKLLNACAKKVRKAEKAAKKKLKAAR